MNNPCSCGSGLTKYALYDARGAFCTYVCTECEEKREKEFRPEIFTNANYYTDEPIEEE
jgi:hypothetical protein